MLPHPVFEQQRIIKTPQDSQNAFYQTHYKPGLVQLLPYRGSQRQQSSTVHVPQQRALPLHHSLLETYKAQNQAVQARPTNIYDGSEHMLRRKTPNGTLAAGYDGTPIQWST